MTGRPLPQNRKVAARKRSIPPEARDAGFSADLDSSMNEIDAAGASGGRGPGGSAVDGAKPPVGRRSEALHAAAGILLTALSALASVWGLVHYTRTSPRFSIHTIDVTGTVHRTPEEVARAGGVEVGRNIFDTDLERARARILEDPWIERASAMRRLPGTVRIEVVERDPAALVAVGDGLYLATRSGEIFKRFEPSDPFDLPTVTGLSPDDFARDRDGAVATVRQALDLVAEYERTGPDKSMPVQEVHIADDGRLVLEVGKPPVALYVGKGPFRKPLEQVARVLAEVGRRHAQAEVVFADNEAHPERVVVRMR